MQKKFGKIFVILFTASLLSLILSVGAAAYIDPATTSYIIQITAAFFITLGVFFTAFTTRARLFFIKIKMKLMEEYYRRKAGNTEKEGTPSSDSLSALFYDDRSFLTRLVLAGLTSLALSFSYIVFSSFDLFMANKNVLPFHFSDIYKPILLTGFLVFLFLSLILSVLKGKIFDRLISLCLGILLAAYIQGNFLNKDFGQLTGDKIPWHEMTRHMLFNSLVWVLLVSIPFVIAYFSKIIWKGFAYAVPALLSAIQIIALVVSFVSLGIASDKSSDLYLSRAGIYEMSTKDNIIVLILDRLDESYVNMVAEYDPTYFDDLDGFTRYTNNMNYYCRTYPSVVNMLTGFITFYDIPAKDFMEKAYKESNFLKDLRGQGYTTKLYMENKYTFAGEDQIKDLADNVIEGSAKIKGKESLAMFLRLSAFKYAPHAMKPSFWMSTSDFSNLSEDEREIPPYTTDDHLYFKNLKEERLSLQKKKSNFIFIHLNGAHAPYNMNEFGQEVPSQETSVRQQTMGAFTVVREFLNQMKELGIYDDANIIITGDHGKSTDIRLLDRPVLTGLFVKRKGESGPLKTSNAPVNADNFRGSVMQMAGVKSSEYSPAYWEVAENSTVVRKYYYRVDIREGERRSFLEEFDVIGDANDFSNWHKIKEIQMKYPHA
ncbi:MAG TPA: sulfatase-like hydrolase/transferase [Clostridiales bacterium]|nr:sulfatase-like hydrolase/transferase [Clostridiales bacterium]